MVFKRVLGSLGVGGPVVDTVLDRGPVRPGGVVRGQVRLRGGGSGCDIEHLALELVARVETGPGGEEHKGGVIEEHEGGVVFDRLRLSGGFRLDAREHRDVPFTIHIPWETPLTELSGQPLGADLGVRAELAARGAKDHGDPEQLIVRPLPVQEAVLGALGRLGFGLIAANLRLGRIAGSGQKLPFHQEFELTPAPRHIHDVNEIALTLLTGPDGMEVVLEADKRGRLSPGPSTSHKHLPGGPGAPGRHTVSHEGLEHRDWTGEVDSWIRALIQARGARTAPTARTGAVAAGVAGATAAGAVGGVVAAGLGDALGSSGKLEKLGNLGKLGKLGNSQRLQHLEGLRDAEGAGPEEEHQG
ncbi:sporulation protein [Streptomyces malaysiensis subsp. malaysiensis]|uniref:sporulation protein n=1 Tax=Streptomyces malaysiensis TaxID=92644 RepID=UPI000BFBD9CE|nr:sporulation protein [Streptomyces malaysiensis]ATL82919.1 SpoOM family protein [Streptomyces malaysiensis]QDL72874.1 sporulation protein [Streptomyces malaysiensis]